MSRTIYVLVFDGYADWEPAFALAELRRTGRDNVVTVGFDRAPITSMGGLQVIPRAGLGSIKLSAAGLLLIPGGNVWEGGHYPKAQLERCLREAEEGGVSVAAICAGTIPVARAGMLNERAHTSNSLPYLKRLAPEYTGDAFFQNQLAVRSRGVVTASGLGPVEFAREIFAELGVFDEVDRALWFEMFKRGTYHEINV